MRVALVHDWLTGSRGGEKVLREFARIFPEATLFTLFHFPGTVSREIERLEIRTTFLQRFVSPTRDYRKLLPLFFAAAETWDLSGFDLVLSSSHCVAKNARAPSEALHVCYSHTPVRYLHDQFDVYLRNRPFAVRAAARLVRAPLAVWDVATAQRVDGFLANSENVRERIHRLYDRPASVVHPPVDTKFFTPSVPERERSGLLIVSALAPYKRLEDAIVVANRGRLALTIAGFGPEERRLRALAGETVRFAGTPTDEALRELYRSATAVLMPGEEDFGIVPLEAQACGTPVVALGRGGARETVRPDATGILYPDSGADGLALAIERLGLTEWNREALVANAARFSHSNFRQKLLNALADAFAGAGRADLTQWVRERPNHYQAIQ